MSFPSDIHAAYDGSPPVHPSLTGLALSGLDAEAYAALFSDGVQTTCAANDKCKAAAEMDIRGSSHRCMGCSLSIHSPMFCGSLFDEWLPTVNSVGFHPSMLAPYGQGKFNDYSDRLGETGLYICHGCIDTVLEKISSSPAGVGAGASSVGLKNVRDNVTTSSTASTLSPPTDTEPEVPLAPPPGLDPDVRTTYFTNGIQTKCAADGKCRLVGSRLEGRSTVCIVCDLAMHSMELCGNSYGRWAATTKKSLKLKAGDIPLVLPDAAKREIARNKSMEHPICARCIMDMEAVLPKPFDWKAFRPQMKWEYVIISASKVHPYFKGKNSPLSQFEGIRVGDDKVVKAADIDVLDLRPLARDMKAIPPGTHNKDFVVDALVKFCTRKAEEKANGVVIPDNIQRSKKDLMWNIGRFINIIFSTEFKDRFALERGQSLTKSQLDAGEKTDQKLYTDFLVAYNDNSKYGDIAFDNSVGMEKSPALFMSIDPSTNWQSAKATFNTLMKNYEKIMKLSLMSGTNGGFESIALDKKSNVFMLYLHEHMLKNKDMLEPCVGILPSSAAFETTTQGGKSNLFVCDGSGRRKRGGGGEGSVVGNGGRKKKQQTWLEEKSSKSNGYIDALSSKAVLIGEASDMEAQKHVMDTRKTEFELSAMKVTKAREAEDYHRTKKEGLINKRRSLKAAAGKKHGDGLDAKVEAAKQKREERVKEGKSTFSLSQDSTIGELLDCEDTLVDTASKHEAARTHLAKVMEEEKENQA